MLGPFDEHLGNLRIHRKSACLVSHLRDVAIVIDASAQSLFSRRDGNKDLRPFEVFIFVVVKPC